VMRYCDVVSVLLHVVVISCLFFLFVIDLMRLAKIQIG
jgi:hypothetical protein